MPQAKKHFQCAFHVSSVDGAISKKRRGLSLFMPRALGFDSQGSQALTAKIRGHRIDAGRRSTRRRRKTFRHALLRCTTLRTYIPTPSFAVPWQLTTSYQAGLSAYTPRLAPFPQSGESNADGLGCHECLANTLSMHEQGNMLLYDVEKGRWQVISVQAVGKGCQEGGRSGVRPLANLCARQIRAMHNR